MKLRWFRIFQRMEHSSSVSDRLNIEEMIDNAQGGRNGICLQACLWPAEGKSPDQRGSHSREMRHLSKLKEERNHVGKTI